MIAACYDMHLYCDVPGCKSGQYERHPGEAEFSGDEHGSTARRRARKRGWWLNARTGTCACPPCAKAGHRPTEPA